MEIINDKRDKRTGEARTRQVYLGIVLAAIGIGWLLRNFDMMSQPVFKALFSWQMLVVVIGGYFLAIRNWAAGTILTVIGLLMIVLEIAGTEIEFRKVILPAAFIVAGISVILERRK